MPSLILLAALRAIQVADVPPLILQEPTVNKTTIVFRFANDLWSVPREGGAATRLTSSPGAESMPRFSPDGKWIAFSGQYDGNTDVFVMPATGGVPKRLTAHPDAEFVTGWSSDGKSVLYISSALSPTDYTQLFSVSVEGGFPARLPFPAVARATMSPDGTKIAYVPNGKWQQAWKRYRGGQTTPIWIGNLSDSKVKAIPRKNWTDDQPMWIGDSIYYLSDAKGKVGLNRYDLKSGRVSEEIPGTDYEFKSASAGDGVIVLEQVGGIVLFDPKTRQAKLVPITIAGDFPQVRTQFKDLSRRANVSDLSPSGQRVVGVARGFIFTSPVSKGDSRIINETPGVDRTSPAWSPDGKTIAYFSDEKGDYQLVLWDAATGKEQFITVGDRPSMFSNIVWSPDGKKLLFEDITRTLFVFDVATKSSTRVDSLLRRGPTSLSARWSPDSTWITYTKDLESAFSAVFVYNVSEKKSTQVTDGLAVATEPCFDRSGKYLYFAASTDAGFGMELQDISSYLSANVTSSIYGISLRKGAPNPLEPESDEEKTAAPGEKPGPVKTVIDLDGIQGRTFALPFPRQSYSSLEPGTPGVLFAIASGTRPTSIDGPTGPPVLHRFSFDGRKVTPWGQGIGGIKTNPDGTKALVSSFSVTSVVSTLGPIGGGAPVAVGDLRVKINPLDEWRRLYWLAVKKQKLSFYDPNVHGVDLTQVAKRYEAFLPHLKTRADLNYLFTEVMGEISVGHMFISGGDNGPAGVPSVPGGLLGADFKFENGRYRLTRVFDGERWNPELYAPLAQPGVEAKAGEYLLEVNGKELRDSTDIYEALEAKAGKQVRVKLGPTPDGKGAREVTVLPVADESNLRFRAWSEDNRRRVFEATGGRVGYVHVPDTNVGGWREFMRYYYAQSGMDGIVVDERFNHGGAIADFLVREMIRPQVAGSRTRYGKDWRIPALGIYGPKVMIINEMSGSGGDIFPHMFRFHKAGTIVGKRTWGAMISNYGFSLPDGANISTPDDAMYNPDGTWMIENVGTPPDIEVELDPAMWRQGKDSQVEAAIAEILKQLAQNPKKPIKRPDYPSIPPFKPGG